jgi:glucose/galactose transporter
MGICNKVAGMIGIFVLVKLLFSDTQTLSKKIESLSGNELTQELEILASRVIVPYVIMTIILVGLALMILKTNLPEISAEEEIPDSSQPRLKAKNSVFDFPHLLLGVLCIFMYVGVEVVAIDTIGLYGAYHGFDLSTASKFGIYCLIALTGGYVLGIIAIPKYISQRKALIVCAIIGFVFAFTAQVTNGWVSIGFIILLSFAHALMWPSIWPLAINGLGRFTKMGSALLIMGVVGGAILPLVYGAIADSSNRQLAYLVLLPCYVYILYFSMRGYKAGRV